MKRFLQTFFCVIFATMLSLNLFSMEVKAATVTSGDSEYEESYGETYIENYDGTVMESVDGWKYEVTNGGAYIKGYTGTETEIVIPSQIDGYVVRGISARAFQDNLTITSVTIPVNIQTIGENAFQGCVMLSEVNFNAKNCTAPSMSSSSVGIFSGAGSCATSFVVNFGDRVEIVPGNLFNSNVERGNDYAYITEINFSDSIEEIGGYAFEDCRALKSVTIGEGVERIGTYAFGDCEDLEKVVFNNNLTDIDAYAFYSCDDLETITFGSNLGTIAEYAFAECISLEKANMKNMVTSIGTRAFYKCSNLSEVTIPESVMFIGDEAFKGTSKLSLINFNAKKARTNSMSSSNHGVFSGAGAYSESLKLVLGAKVAIVPANMFNANVERNADYAYITEVVFPKSVKTIEAYAFEDCRALKKITLGKAVEDIQAHAFEDCEALETVVFNDKVKTIGDNAFYSCDNLNNVTLAKAITSIGEYAFAECKGMDKITIKATSIKVAKTTFSKCNPSMTIVCYYGSGLKEVAENAGCKYSYITPNQPTISKVETVNKGVKIKWSKVTGAEGYIVLRKTGDGKYKQIAKVKNTASSYTDTKASAGKTNTYTVQAYAGNKKSSYDKTGLKTLYLKATTISSVENGSSSITLKWKKVTGAKEYKIYRSKGSGKYILLKTVKGTSYTDKKSITNGTKYSYKIVALNGKYSSVYSSEKANYYLSKTSFSSKKSTSKGTLTLKWKKNTKASGYQIMYSTSSSLKNPKYIKVSGSKNVSKVIKGLKTKKNYYICIRSYKTSNGKTYYSEWSTKVKVKTK